MPALKDRRADGVKAVSRRRRWRGPRQPLGPPIGGVLRHSGSGRKRGNEIAQLGWKHAARSIMHATMIAPLLTPSQFVIRYNYSVTEPKSPWETPSPRKLRVNPSC